MFMEMRLNPYFKPYARINSKWIRIMNTIAKALNLLEEILGININNLEIGNGYLYMTSKTQEKKKEIWLY